MSDRSTAEGGREPLVGSERLQEAIDFLKNRRYGSDKLPGESRKQLTSEEVDTYLDLVSGILSLRGEREISQAEIDEMPGEEKARLMSALGEMRAIMSQKSYRKVNN